MLKFMPTGKLYQDTADLTYGEIDRSFAPISGQEGDFLSVESLIGFGSAVGVRSGSKQCMVNKAFAAKDDLCEINPINCQFGISFSIWVRVYYNNDVFDLTSSGPEDKQYFMSTGGDTNGSPGLATGVRKQDLFATVSTGMQYWNVNIRGPVPNNTWVNIGVRWNKDSKGLEVFVNNVKKGQQLYPQNSATPKPPNNPPVIMIGCHRSSDSSNYTGFANADLDEASIWERALDDSETEYFLGGYDKNSTNLLQNPAYLAKVINDVDLKNTNQRTAALKLLSQLTQRKSYCSSSKFFGTNAASTSLFDNSYLSSVPISENDVNDLKNLGLILHEILKEDNVPDSIAFDDATTVIKSIAGSLSSLLSPCNTPTWLRVQNETEDISVIQLISKFRKWYGKFSQNMNISNEYPFCNELLEDNIYIKSCKITVADLKTMSGKVTLPDYTSPSLQQLRKMWQDILFDRIAFPTSVITDARCQNRHVTFYFHYYGFAREVASDNVNPMEMDRTNARAVDSRIMAMDMAIDPGRDEYGDYDPTQPICQIDHEILKQQTVVFKLEHSNPTPSKSSRSLLLFQNMTDSEIEERQCVWWNDDLSDIGAWDNRGCFMLQTTAQFSKCSCSNFGLFSIIAIQATPKTIPDEQLWIFMLKYGLYFLSALAMILYISVVMISRDLHDQFHLIGVNLAASILAGSISMVFTDFATVKDDRNACTLMGTLIHLFYGGVGVWMLGLGHAAFKGITSGIIGGRLTGYMSICWGFAIACVGIPFIFMLPEMGTDPRCFIGWSNDVKLVFFLPQMSFCLLSLVLAFIILCNISTSALRKENLIEDYGSFCRGAALLLIELSATWTFGLFAYFRFSFYLNGPNFYPIFNVLNASAGLCLFVFIGLGSRRFVAVLSGQAKLRREMLKNFAFGLPMAQDERKPK